MRRSSPPKFLANLSLKYAILITLLLATILFFIAFFGIQKSKSNMLEVMEREGKALLESLILASKNTISANLLIEDLSADKLLDIAKLVDRLDTEGKITEQQLSKIANLTGVLRIDILDKDGKIVQSNNPFDKKIYEDTSGVVYSVLNEFINEETEEVFFKIEKEDILKEIRYGVIKRRSEKKGAILAVAPAWYFRGFEEKIGIGYFIQRISQEAGIEYILLQSEDGIVFASKKVERMLKIETDPFLQKSLNQNISFSRITPFEGRKILEVVKPFLSEKYPKGIFRLGLSLEGYNQVSESYTRQMIFFAIILFILGIVLIGIVVINQSYFVLDRSFKQIKTITGNVLEGMESGVVAVNQDGKIIIINRVAESIFSLKKEDVLNKDYLQVFPEDEPLLKKTLKQRKFVRGKEEEFKTFSGEEKFLIIGTSTIYDDEGQMGGAVSVIHDVTELKKFEEEAKRAERLKALGSLAAGVAHEIRNPLNAISIATQRLKKEFIPTKNEDEYTSFTNTILKEIKRLDLIINQFLSLAKAHKLNLAETDLNSLLNEILKLVEMEAQDKKVKIEKRIEKLPKIRVDKEELKKALLNILLNSVQATPKGGKVFFESFFDESKKSEGSFGEVLIKVKDSGPGIPKENLRRIFQPYFTTKEKGTGLGLAIAYRIIADHKGKIEVQSEEGKGTTFTIKLSVK